jgi:hypothetical protein
LVLLLCELELKVLLQLRDGYRLILYSAVPLDRLRILDKRKASEREYRKRGTKNIRFCFQMFFYFIIVLKRLRNECVHQ